MIFCVSLTCFALQVSKHTEDLRVENDGLMIENAQIRDRLSFIENMAGMSGGGGGDSLQDEGRGLGVPGPIPPSTSSGGPPGGGVYNPGTAALIELQELRNENSVLHDQLRSRGSVNALGSKPGSASSRAGRFAKQLDNPPPLTPFTPVALRQAVGVTDSQQGVKKGAAIRRSPRAVVAAAQGPTSRKTTSPTPKRNSLGRGQQNASRLPASEGGSRSVAGSLSADPPPVPSLSRSTSAEGMVPVKPGTAEQWGSWAISGNSDGVGTEETGAKMASLMAQRSALSRASMVRPEMPTMAVNSGGTTTKASKPPKADAWVIE